MHAMSTETRKYELKARAERQRETRDRIAAAAAALHEEEGVARTTVAEIARRADVSRLTVYNHFADLSELLPACSAHYMARHPFPDVDDALAAKDPRERVRMVLALTYAWFRETEPMFGKLFSDRATVPELDRFMAREFDRMQAELADALTAALPERRALIRLALDFWTWRRLSAEGLDDTAAAALMTTAVAAR